MTSIAKSAKAIWNYPQEWLELWEDDLTITPDLIRQYPTYMILMNNEIGGFCMLKTRDSGVEIEHFWIHSAFQHKGLGKELLSFILSLLKGQCASLGVLSDPNAKGFYEKFGFVETHQVAGIPKGRQLPYLLFQY